MPVNHWVFAYALGTIGLLPVLAMAGEKVSVEANELLFSPAPQAGGQAGSGGGSNPATAPAQPADIEVPSVNSLDTKAGYWFWVALLGFAGLVCLSCFKNSKRSHNT